MSAGRGPAPGSGWWDDAVVYQIYPRSFQDSNGDGVGDLAGIVSRLDHLAWLGVDALWCTPITVSPNADFGYDVADFTAVDPSFGTLADFDTLVAEAKARGLRVLLDLVPNHTSDRHRWFLDPVLKPDYYVWTDRPNNWQASFGGSAWQYDAGVGRHYLHNFLVEQPDLNWWNPAVRDEFDRILRFWFDRGTAGFRIDVAHGLIHDRELRDNPLPGPRDPELYHLRGQVPMYNERRPEVHEIYRRWRRLAGEYDPERLLMGETYVLDPDEWAAYYGRGDELQLALNFMLQWAPFEPSVLQRVVETSLATLRRVVGDEARTVWHGSSHDTSRLATRWCGGDEAKVRVALTMLFTLPGATVLFQGDEIGLVDGVVPPDRWQDRAQVNRDPERTPMQWSDEPQAGFTTGEPWLPVGDHRRQNVAAQRQDPESILHLTRELIALKRRLAGPYQALEAPDGVWRYRRGDITVELDFANSTARVDG
ncbi:MAG: alpha-amylase family glycosyl hydrolase [Candidatus Dormibacteraeota bacterium]|nr:alpha-amylase family glycosyl hydrolase [Candidatus Dormibacteraeota bacterium]